MKATGANWKIDGGRASGEELVPGGGAGVRGAGGNVHLEVAGGLATVVVDIGGVDDGERSAAPRHAEDTGMESRQSLACGAESSSLFRDCIAGCLRRGTFFGDVAAIALAPDRAPALYRVSVFLPAAAGGAEFFFDEPVAGLL